MCRRFGDRLAALGMMCAAAALVGAEETAAPVSAADPVVHIYRSVGATRLEAHVFAPPDAELRAPRPAVAIFHGGGWTEGEPEWTHPMCRYFASRGMVAVGAQYRLSDERDVTPLEAMDDAREVIRWLRREAGRLGIDSQRVAAAGWSAGGHLAASAAVFTGPVGSDDAPPGAGVSPAPDALLLWFPAVSLTNDAWFAKLLLGRAAPAAVSPAEHVRPGLPPAVVFQGTRDRVTPLVEVRQFVQAMERAGNRCELHVYPGRGHLFTRDLEDYRDTMVKADRFLVSLGFLEGEPDAAAIRRFKEQAASPPPPASPAQRD